MKYYVIAGEASGDLHASNLIRALVKQDPEAQIRCWGGDKMVEASAGRAFLVKHYRDLAYMGFLEVLLHLKIILRNMAFCRKDIKEFEPDVVILVDYPGFNLRIAKFVSKQGYKVVYYIAPQVWAWHTSRVKQIQKYIWKVYAVLPFEPSFYATYGIEASFLGHPLLDAIQQYPFSSDLPIKPLGRDEKLITIMPGSRKQEIEKIFPIMLKAASHWPEYRFVVAATHHMEENLYDQYMKEYPQVVCVYDRTYDLLSVSCAAIVKSGTSTLETALLKVPQVVCYKANAISYAIAKKLVKNIKYISLVNLILDREAVKELIQSDLTEEKLVEEMGRILKDPNFIKKQMDDYKDLVTVLGKGGASERVAQSIWQQLKRL